MSDTTTTTTSGPNLGSLVDFIDLEDPILSVIQNPEETYRVAARMAADTAYYQSLGAVRRAILRRAVRFHLGYAR